MLDLRDPNKQLLVILVRKILMHARREELQPLKELLESDTTGDLSIADWGDALVMEVNRQLDPNVIVFEKVITLIQREMDTNNFLTDEEYERAQGALEIGLGMCRT